MSGVKAAMRTTTRFMIIAALLVAPLAVIGKVQASGERFIGEAQKFGNGSGLVIAIGVQRN
jgi:hypothetical protein